jgi:Ca-activated chloride channel family protein
MAAWDLADIHVAQGGAMKTTTALGKPTALVVALVLLLTSGGWTSGLARQKSAAATPQSGQGSQVAVPNRPEAPLYQGEQGTQGSEIIFVPSTRTVTMKLHVEDPNGYFLPNLRRENFVVYEDGVRQKNVTVEIEHAPLSVALLMEFGGRYHELNKALGLEVPLIGRELLDVVGRDDKVSILKYDAKLETLADFKQGHEVLDDVFNHLSMQNFSEVNFFDALLETLSRMRDVTGRKAIILVSTGIDTFSKASYQQVLEVARSSGTPIYTIGLVHLIQRESAVYGTTAPFARIDWPAAEKQLENLAKVSGGRAYALQSDPELPAIYDDIMENLRVRYVITYVSSNAASFGLPRKIQVELVDPKTGQALKIHDATGKPVAAKVFVQQTYDPGAASGD